jgi:hypothetical protein
VSVPESRVALDLDVLAYVPGSAPLPRLAREWLGPALAAQLRAAGAALAATSGGGGVGALGQVGLLHVLVPCHFLPPGRSHHVCVLYPQLKQGEEANVAALAPFRRALHALLGLPLDRPALRPATRLAWATAAPTGEGGVGQVRLPTVHVGLPPPGDAVDSVHLVQGAYDYHHYMQVGGGSGRW